MIRVLRGDEVQAAFDTDQPTAADFERFLSTTWSVKRPCTQDGNPPHSRSGAFPATDILVRVDHVQRLLMAAIDEQLGFSVGSDRLIARRAHGRYRHTLARLLAGLSRGEEPEAHDLFAQVMHEMGLAPALPAHPTQAGGAASSSTAAFDPSRAGRLIWREGWEKLGHPPELYPVIAPVDQWQCWTEDYTVPRETYREEIVSIARQLLTGWSTRRTGR